MVQCLEAGRSYVFNDKENMTWSLATAELLTILLMRNNEFSVSPGSAIVADVNVDYHDKIIQDLRIERLIRNSNPLTDHQKDVALKATKNWIADHNNRTQIANEITRMKSNENYKDWIRWVATHAWKSHSLRHMGLVDEVYKEDIAAIINISVEEISEVQEMSKDIDKLDSLAKNVTDDSDILINAYVAAAKIRGENHKFIANDNKLKHLTHFIREHNASTIYTFDNRFDIVNQDHFLARLILHGALEQETLDRRIGLWIESIVKVNKYFAQHPEEYQEVHSFEAGLDLAVKIARKCNVQVVKKDLDKSCHFNFKHSNLLIYSLLFQSFNYPIQSVAIYAGGELASKAIDKLAPNLVNDSMYFFNKRYLKKMAGGGLIKSNYPLT